MKKLLLAMVLLVSLTAFADPGIDEVLEQQFRTAFPSATSVKWFENKDSYDVYFVNHNIQCRISYDLEGNMQHMRRDYKKEVLPAYITAMVAKRFPGKTIYGVTEITNPDGLQYHMVLEDQDRWYFVEGTSGGSLTLNKKLRKI